MGWHKKLAFNINVSSSWALFGYHSSEGVMEVFVWLWDEMAQCPDQQVLDPGWIFVWNVAVLSSNNSWFDRNEEGIGQGKSWEAEQSVFGQSILKK